jgi:hypothetical protein
MSSFIKGMDSHTGKQYGENNHVEYSVSNQVDENIVQFFFQLVRNKDHSALEHLHNKIMRHINTNLKDNYYRLMMMYKLIGQTRDIVSGKGEQQLAFMQIWGLYKSSPVFENLAKSALYHFVIPINGKHPYGSWKDIKYFCTYIKDKSQDENHPLIEFAINVAINQLGYDLAIYNKSCQSTSGSFEQIVEDAEDNEKESLAAKWIPREKSKKFGWVFKKMAMMKYSHYLETAVTPQQKRRAVLKGRIELNKTLTTINKKLETTQIAQCDKDWSSIDFNKVTSATTRKQSLAFAYKDKKGKIRGMDDDRLKCSSKYTNHLNEIKSGSTKHKIHGRRVNVYELVQDAYELSATPPQEKVDTINLQWKDNTKNNKGLGNIIACSDTSYSMTVDNNIPLYNSIGLGIRVSELTHSAFKDRLLTFAARPVWHNLTGCKTFIDKVQSVKTISTGLNTDFYAAMKMILDVILENEIPPDDVSGMILAVFSDMQIDAAISKNSELNQHLTRHYQKEIGYMDSMYEVITKMYANAGLESKYKAPYLPPHILFWNLRKTDGFPCLSTQRNVTMLSGYSSTLLNVFCEKGIDGLREFTPRKMLKDLLDNERYNIMENDIREFYIAEAERCGGVICPDTGLTIF